MQYAVPLVGDYRYRTVAWYLFRLGESETGEVDAVDVRLCMDHPDQLEQLKKWVRSRSLSTA